MTEEVKAEKFGTEFLERIIKEGVEVYKVAKDKLSDGFQWQKDTFPIVWEVKDLAFIVTSWEKIAEEGTDISFEEFEALVNKIVTEIGGTSESVQELIQNATVWIDSSYKMYQSIKRLVEEKQVKED